MKKQKSTVWFILCILLQNLIYGVGNPMTKIGMGSISALWCLSTRFTLTAVVMLLIFGKRIVTQLHAAGIKKWLPPSICLTLNFICFNLALLFTTVTTTAFLNSMAVLFAPGLAALFLHKKYRLTTMLIQLAAVFGLFLLCCNGHMFTFGIGEALALLSALAAAGALVFAQKSLGEIDPVAISAAQVIVTAVISTALAFLFDDVRTLANVQAQTWWIIVYLGLVCSCGAYILQNVALGRLSAGSVSMLQCLQPVMTAIFSYLMIRETMSWVGIAGAVVITLSVVMNTLNDNRAEKKALAAS